MEILNSQKKLALKTPDGFVFLDYAEIIRFEANRNSCVLYEVNKMKSEIILHSFKEILEKIEGSDQFYKCHRSHIVSFKYVKRFNVKTRIITMEQGEVPISEQYIMDFMSHFCK